MITLRIKDVNGRPRDVNLTLSSGEHVQAIGPDKYQIVSDMPKGYVTLFTGTESECLTAFDRLIAIKSPCYQRPMYFYDMRERETWVKDTGPDHYLK